MTKSEYEIKYEKELASPCIHCGCDVNLDAAPSGVFLGCRTIKGSQDDFDNYCNGYWEFNPVNHDIKY